MDSSSEFEEFSSGAEQGCSDWESEEPPVSRFRVVTLHDIAMAQRGLVDTVAETVGITSDEAVILLSKNKWRDESAISKVFDNPEYLKGLGLPEFSRVQRVSGSIELCPICCEECVPGTHLGCGHSVCDECFLHYIQIRLEDRDVLNLTCPGASQCKLSCTSEFVRQFCSNYTYRYFLKILAEMFVTAHRDRYCGCPSPDCRFYIEAFEPITESHLAVDTTEEMISTATKDMMAACHCSGTFCFLCGEGHLPISCSFVKHWLSLSSEASLLWISEYTKPCPKCSAPIQKGKGCDHMTCRCGYQFCWNCLSNFTSYGHRCPSVQKQLPESKDPNSKSTMHIRLLAYSSRFILQQSHQKFHQSLLSSQVKLNSGMDPLDEFYIHLSTEAGTSLDAHRVLANSRGLVAWTFVLLLFVEDGNDRDILEDLIIDLQNASEALSSIIGRGKRPNKDSLLLKSRYIEQRSSILLSHITTTHWTFIPLSAE